MVYCNTVGIFNTKAGVFSLGEGIRRKKRNEQGIGNACLWFRVLGMGKEHGKYYMNQNLNSFKGGG